MFHFKIATNKIIIEMSQNKKTASSSIGKHSRDQPRETKLSHSNKAAGFSFFIFLSFPVSFEYHSHLLYTLCCAEDVDQWRRLEFKRRNDTAIPRSFISNEPHGKETRTHNVLRDSKKRKKKEIKLYLLRQKTFFFILFSFFFFFFWRNEIEGV